MTCFYKEDKTTEILKLPLGLKRLKLVKPLAFEGFTVSYATKAPAKTVPATAATESGSKSSPNSSSPASCIDTDGDDNDDATSSSLLKRRVSNGGMPASQQRANGGARAARRKVSVVVNETYWIESIVASRRGPSPADDKYYCKWHGYGDDDNTWEPPAHIPPEMVQAFLRQEEAKRKQSRSDSGGGGGGSGGGGSSSDDGGGVHAVPPSLPTALSEGGGGGVHAVPPSLPTAPGLSEGGGGGRGQRVGKKLALCVFLSTALALLFFASVAHTHARACARTHARRQY